MKQEPKPGRTAAVSKMLKSTKPLIDFGDDDDDFFADAKPKEKKAVMEASLDGHTDAAILRNIKAKSAVPSRIFPECSVPDGHFAISTSYGESRILILDKMGKDWDDLLCYNYSMHITQSVARRDLMPKERVDEAIAFIQKLK
jgi:hypothetical protein